VGFELGFVDTNSLDTTIAAFTARVYYN
jgi:hypothetical protein